MNADADPKTIECLVRNWKNADRTRRREIEDEFKAIGTPAIEYLISALGSEDRILGDGASDLLSHAFGTQAIEPLIRALENENPHIRSAAIWTLSCFKDKRTLEPLEPLMTLLDDPEGSVRGSAATAVRDIGDERTFERLLIMAQTDKDTYARGSAVYAMSAFDDERAVDACIAALSDENGDVRMDAALGLASMARHGHEVSRAVPHLISSLDDEDDSARQFAIYALGDIELVEAVEPLINHLENEKDPTAKAWTANALAKIGDARAVQPIIRLLKKSNHSKVRRAAADALTKFDSTQAHKALDTAIDQKDMDVIIGAHDYCIRKGKPGTETLLIKALNSVDNLMMAILFIYSENEKLAEAGNAYYLKHFGEAAPSEDHFVPLPKWSKGAD